MVQDGRLRIKRAMRKRNKEAIAALRAEGRSQRWLCADGRRMSAKEMRTEHKINVLRMAARRLISDTGLPYNICVALAIAKHALLFEMACQIADAGEDPFKDQGGVLSQENADGDYSLSDIITLPGEKRA